jgi:long-chain acyl-CoA synthetase
MAQSGETVTYAELERRSNRLAHFLRASGLGPLDHYAVFMENNVRYVECCSAGERAGLYYTCVNSYLTPEELAYILDNSESKFLITSTAKRDVALQAMTQCPRIDRCVVVDGLGDGDRVLSSNQSPQSQRSEPTSRPAGLHLKKRLRLSHDRGPPHFSGLPRITVYAFSQSELRKSGPCGAV